MTKLGKLFYNITVNSTPFLVKHKWLYYTLLFTWGGIMTYLGCIISVVLMIAGNPPIKFLLGWHFEIGLKWGGVDFGFPFVCSQDSSEELKCHELGHSIQNAIFGPFAILISFIPSFIRCEYRSIKYSITKKPNKTRYDDIWFEGSATTAGLLIKDLLNKKGE